MGNTCENEGLSPICLMYDVSIQNRTLLLFKLDQYSYLTIADTDEAVPFFTLAIASFDTPSSCFCLIGTKDVGGDGLTMMLLMRFLPAFSTTPSSSLLPVDEVTVREGDPYRDFLSVDAATHPDSSAHTRSHLSINPS